MKSLMITKCVIMQSRAKSRLKEAFLLDLKVCYVHVGLLDILLAHLFLFLEPRYFESGVSILLV